jgi:glucokinase
MAVLGIDIGGTKIAAGVVTGRAEVLRSMTVQTRALEGYEVSIAQVFRTIEECLRSDVEAIGICAPGPLNPKTGVVLNPPNLPGWRNIPLVEMVAKRFGFPCLLENDANAAGLAETLFGAARGCSSVFYATLSTGIGAGIILDRRIYHGKNGAAAEGGHVTIDYKSNVICNCGTPGCIEALASGGAIARTGRTAEQIAQAAAGGDETSIRILDEVSTMLGAWLGSIVNLLDPEIIVIGGGVSRIGDPLFSRLRRIVPTRTINQFAGQTPIVPAQLGENVGILGAASILL